MTGVRACEIASGLFQSGLPDRPEDLEPYDAIVSLHPPAVVRGDKATLVWVIPDDEMSDPEIVRSIAKWIVMLIFANKRVLVHCQAGYNRSSLVTARTLIELGMPPAQAVQRVRDVIPQSPNLHALMNGHFERWLLAGG